MSPRSSAIWSVVHDERRVLIEDLAGLEPRQWLTPSMCPGWDVHDVLAHLVDSAQTTKLGFVGSMVVAGFDFDKDNAVGVAKERSADPRHTLDRFKAVATRTTGPPAPLATRLVEAFVHGEDIRRPLGIHRDYPVSEVLIALKLQTATSRNWGGGQELVEGLRLVVSDAELQYGQGAEVRGSAIALLLAVSGRPVRPAELSGPGATQLLVQPNS